MWSFTITWRSTAVQHSTQASGVRPGEERRAAGSLSLTHRGLCRTIPFANAQWDKGKCLLQHPVSFLLWPEKEAERLKPWHHDLPYQAGWPWATALANRMLELVPQRSAAFSSLTQSLGDFHKTAGIVAILESWERMTRDLAQASMNCAVACTCLWTFHGEQSNS